MNKFKSIFLKRWQLKTQRIGSHIFYKKQCAMRSFTQEAKKESQLKQPIDWMEYASQGHK